MENIDVNFAGGRYNNRHQVLQKYTAAIHQLRALAEQSYRVRPFYFDNYVLFQYFQQRSNELDGPNTLTFFRVELLKHILDRRRQILYWSFYLSLVLLCVLAYRHETSTDVAQRSVRKFVYPGMRMWRRMTLPLIRRFPRLTEYYDESCLMENPFFQIEDLSCEPCANVQGVLDLSARTDSISFENLSREAEQIFDKISESQETPTKYVPFVFKINQSPIQLMDFYEIYANNHEIFQRDAYRVQSTNRDITNLEQLFGDFNHSEEASHAQRLPSEQTHYLWRCNRMLPARLLRKIFSRPARLPTTGIALERYMAIDTPQAPTYTLPGMECPNVYIQQALGIRFIILRPTSECRHRCRTLSIRLPQSFVLSYNWLYWKPISAPDPVSETLSISLIGSYC